MLIYPAIDLYGGKAVRLYKGDYAQMTVYNDDPVAVARDFKEKGAVCIHLVDLEGARLGTTPNFDTVCAIKKETGLFCEIGGGIRDMDTIDRYVAAGINRVILGTAAVTSPGFVQQAAGQYGDKIAVGVSGGKDSMLLLLALNHLKSYYPKKFELEAITIELGFEGMDFEPVAVMCNELGIPYTRVKTDIKEVVFDVFLYFLSLFLYLPIIL